MKILPGLFFSFISLLLCQAGFAQNGKKNKNDLETEGIKGKVKSVLVLEFKAKADGSKEETTPFRRTINTYNKAGNLTEIDYYVDSNLVRKTSFLYDDKGNRTDEQNFDGKGNAFNSNHYKFDKKGNQIETVFRNSQGNLEGAEMMTYDTAGNVLTYKLIDNKGKTVSNRIYKHDEQSNITEEDWLNENKIVNQKYLFGYDQKGNMTSKIDYRNELLVSKTSYTYYSQGNKTEELCTNDRGNQKYKYTYSYDKDGHLIKANQIEPGGTEITNYTTFDKKGNWTQSIVIKNDTPREITAREIVYY